MPKSAIDATRFTPTTPHASAKQPSPPAAAASHPGASSSSRASALPLPPRTPASSGETPQQKVRRLREAAARARDAKVSGFDKFILRSRVWADRAHRFTALSLIGITGIAGVITVYALGDMMIHNRRKRREYFAQQKALHDAALFDARTALRHGAASEEQAALVEREEMERSILEVREQEKIRRREEGIFVKAKGWLFSGLKKEDVVGGEVGEGVEAMPQQSAHEERTRLVAAGMGTAPGDQNEGVGGMIRESPILRAVEEQNAETREKLGGMMTSTDEGERNGGMLDNLGTASGDGSGETPTKARGWMGFMSRR